MKNLNILLAVALFSGLLSCKKSENVQKDIIGLGGDTWNNGLLDAWLNDNFTKPYNIEVKYRWDGTETDNTKTLSPPKEEKVIPTMETVKAGWMEVYKAEIGETFLKKYSPRQYVLVGSLQYNSGGTVTLGEAEGANKVTLFNLNNFDKANRDIIKPVLKTIHHEFGHILHQTIMYPKEYPLVTPGGYTADWNNTTLAEANAGGFITQYSQADPNEDFVEVISKMLTEGKAGYNALVNGIVVPNPDPATVVAKPFIPNKTAQEALRKKEQIIVAYFKQNWGIDFYRLQNRTQSAMNQMAPFSPAQYLGFGKSYTALSINPGTITGMSADFMLAYTTAKTNLAALVSGGTSGRTLGAFSLNFTLNNQAILTVNYTNSAGSPLIATFTYNVATDANQQLSLTFVSRDANANTVGPVITTLTNYLTQNKFVFKWSYPADMLAEYVSMQKATDPGSFMLGVLSN